ncbi:MAG: hypothetical protein KDI65_09500 [Alphaproteobacteria bacterium]|nr:hypothetical protein [Alphaproteobacteria bacterium]
MYRTVRYVVAAGTFVAIVNFGAMPALAEHGEFSNIQTLTGASRQESKDLRDLTQDFFAKITTARLALERKNMPSAVEALNRAGEDLGHISNITDRHPEEITIMAGRAGYKGDAEEAGYFFPVSDDGHVVISKEGEILIRDRVHVAKEDIKVHSYRVRFDPEHMGHILEGVRYSMDHENYLNAATLLSGASEELFSLEEGENTEDS